MPVTVAAGVTIASSTVSYWPANDARQRASRWPRTRAGGPGATLATLDTTMLPNGSYIIDVNGTDDHGNQQDNEILVAVAGDYKPGRVVVDVTEFTVPVARHSDHDRPSLRQPEQGQGRRTSATAGR